VVSVWQRSRIREQFSGIDKVNKIFLRMKAKSTFENVTKELLTISATITDPDLAACLTGGDSTVPASLRTNVFNPCFENFFWTYDNNGLKLLQLRFYPES
jgi:hypothetical protein